MHLYEQKSAKHTVSKGKSQNGRIASARIPEQLHHLEYFARSSPEDCDRSTNALMDSRASKHVVRDSKLFQSMENIFPIAVKLADGKTTTACQKTCVHVQFSHAKLMVRCVYHTPTLYINLLSCTRPDEQGITMKFSETRCILTDRNRSNRLL